MQCATSVMQAFSQKLGCINSHVAHPLRSLKAGKEPSRVSKFDKVYLRAVHSRVLSVPELDGSPGFASPVRRSPCH